ncbi:MAG TPA: hypothetical protein VED63_01200, partial [Acidimicrobiales bacterium]|nr:hypothetical protein [Acidimicrobiales bacterium]
MDRTHAGVARPRDGFDTPGRRTPDGGAPKRAGLPLAVFGAFGLALVLATGAGRPDATPTRLAPASDTTPGLVTANKTPPVPALSLLAQPPYVLPGQEFPLRLSIGPAVPAGTTMSVTVYDRVTSRSALGEVFAGSGLGPALSSSRSIAVSSLPVDPAGGVDLTIGLITGGNAAPTGAGAQVTADLHCSIGACGGVYPVRLTLSAGGSGATNPELITTLVYTDPPATTERLQVALAVPLSLPADPATPSGQVNAPSAGDVARFSRLVAALDANAGVPTTLIPDPATTLALALDTRPRSRQVLEQLLALDNLPNHEAVAGPFVPVDAAGLVGAGLPGELTTQVDRGSQALADEGIRATSGTWVSSSPIDASTLAQLATIGFDHIVLPPASLSGASFRLTPTQPLTVAAGRAQNVTVALDDPVLAGHFAGASGPGAVLAANQMLADLALIYYEEPNLPTARAVVAVAPTQWSPDAGFLDTLLRGLSANPVLEPVTAASVFDSVPHNGTTELRRNVPDTAANLPARAIRSARADVDAFATATSDPTVARRLDDLLLASESALLRPARQASGVKGTVAALDAQLEQVSIAAGTIRLTSSTAHVPITITKTAPYSVTSIMVLSSDKLTFPSGNRRTVVLDRATDAFYVDMKARTGGVFRVTVTLWSPRGGLVLASRQLTVRSLSTSAVALFLSIGAVAVLFVWWGRTVRRRHHPSSRRRRGAHARRR